MGQNPLIFNVVVGYIATSFIAAIDVMSASNCYVNCSFAPINVFYKQYRPSC